VFSSLVRRAASLCGVHSTQRSQTHIHANNHHPQGNPSQEREDFGLSFHSRVSRLSFCKCARSRAMNAVNGLCSERQSSNPCAWQGGKAPPLRSRGAFLTESSGNHFRVRTEKPYAKMITKIIKRTHPSRSNPRHTSTPDHLRARLTHPDARKACYSANAALPPAGAQVAASSTYHTACRRHIRVYHGDRTHRIEDKQNWDQPSPSGRRGIRLGSGSCE